MGQLDKNIEFNKKCIYNNLLNLEDLNPEHTNICLEFIFERDIKTNSNFKFKMKQINPTRVNNTDEDFDRLFLHLTTIIVDKKNRKRVFDPLRSKRFHWIKHHVDETKKSNMKIFSVDDGGCIRTYIYDEDEFYVIVLEVSRPLTEYYLLTAYYCDTYSYKRKIENKYRRRLPTLY
jgi:hypothetical protein